MNKIFRVWEGLTKKEDELLDKGEETRATNNKLTIFMLQKNGTLKIAGRGPTKKKILNYIFGGYHE